MRWTAGLTAILLSLAASPAAAATLAESGAALRQEAVAPLYAGHRAAAEALAAVEADCAGPWREPLRPAYRDAVLAWRQLEATGFGPASVPETAARVFFWPDAHGTAGRQLGAALKSRDPQLETAAGLEGQSAGLQSLAALELLLYGGPPADAAADVFACRYAQAIADFQAELAREFEAGLAAVPADGEATARALVIGMRTALDTLIQLDLERPLGADLADARGQRARAWRSGLSLALIGAALETVERLYAAPQGFGALIAGQAEVAPFGAVMGQRLEAAQAMLGQVALPLHEAVSDPAARPQVEALLEELRTMRRLVVERLAPALGVAAGFNALDGD